MKIFVILFAVALQSSPVLAEIQKTAIPGEQGFQFYWWPVVDVPSGWHQDQEASFHYSSNALATNGATFKNATSVMYAKAIFKPRVPQHKSLKDLIASDQDDFRSHDNEIVIDRIPSFSDGDGKVLDGYRFESIRDGNWEMVAYGSEGDYYLVFTLSARSEADLNQSFEIFKAVIQQYKEKRPNKAESSHSSP